MSLRINYPNFIRQLFPPCKRQSSRLALLKGFIEPLRVLFEGFSVWHNGSRMTINVNSQVKVLEECLRKKYNEPVRIGIMTYSNMLLLADLLSERRAMWPEFGLIGENCFRFVPLENEVRDKFDGADFVVYIPLEVDEVLIEAEVKKYKQVLTTYEIIQKWRGVYREQGYSNGPVKVFWGYKADR